MAPRMRAVSLYSSIAASEHSLDQNLISEILDYPGPFQDEKEKAMCRKMVEELSPKEQEIIARTSYVYWFSTVVNGDHPSDELRIRTAMKEARRHLEKRSYERAMESLRASIKYRQEWKVDLLRLCFAGNNSIVGSLSNKDREFLTRAEKLIEAELKRNPMVIRGYDRENRPIIHRSYPRQRPMGEAALEQYTLGMIYIIERALACNEVRNKGLHDKVVAVADYSGYKSHKGNPITFTVETAKIFRKNYPNRAYKVIILDAPLFMRGFYAILSPFIAAETKEKLKFVSGNVQKRNVFGPTIIDPEQAPSFMTPDGKLEAEVDMEIFMYIVPFYALYDHY